MFSVGIIGLPNVGKSTLFKLLSKKEAEIAPYPFTTIDPNKARVPLPDKRLEKIAEMIEPEKVTPTFIEFLDIAGLVKEAHQGKGLGNQFLSHIQQCQALLEVVRAFEAENIEHPEGTINPKRDMEIIQRELLEKDLQSVESFLKKEEKKAKTGDKEAQTKTLLLQKIKKGLQEKKAIAQLSLSKKETSLLKEFAFLSAKPIIYFANQGAGQIELPQEIHLSSDLKWEEELSNLPPKERKELEQNHLLDRVITACYNALGLITFYTITGGKEVRAWRLKRGSLAPQAGGKVHTDFEEKFIRAEVLPFEKLVEIGSWQKAKQKGLIKTVGKDYEVKDGDIIEFKI